MTFGKNVRPLADCLLSFLCLEDACLALEAFQNALCYLRTLLSGPGATRCWVVTFYIVGADRFAALPRKEKFVGEEAPPGSGFTIKKPEEAQRAAETLPECADHRGMLFLVARRGG